MYVVRMPHFEPELGSRNMFKKTLIVLFGIGPLVALPVGLLTPLIHEWVLRFTRFIGITDFTTFNDPFSNALLAAWIATCTVLIIETYGKRHDYRQ